MELSKNEASYQAIGMVGGDFLKKQFFKIKKVPKIPEGFVIQDNSELDIIEPITIIADGNVKKKLTIENNLEIEREIEDYDVQ